MKEFMSLVARKLGLKGRQSLDEAALQRLRDEHRLRCHHFRLLLAANNTALQIMAELEEALQGERAFSLGFVRNRCVRACASVRQMISHLGVLSGGRYGSLVERHRQIQLDIQKILNPGGAEATGPLTLSLDKIVLGDAGETGSKMATLAESARTLSLRIPEGFVITASGYRRFMEANDLQAEIDRLIQSSEPQNYDECLTVSAAIQKLVSQSPVPADLAEAILREYARLRELIGPQARIALRSSALGEDLRDASFAGQYRSELNVGEDSLLDSYREIVASKYGVTAMSYRLARGIPDEGVAMCVGCMRMVEAAAGGVAYSRDPLSGKVDDVVISSVFGLPQAVVDGSGESDRFELSRAPLGLRRSAIARKSSRIVPDVEGVRREPLDGGEAGRASIDEETALRIAVMVLKIEELYGQPQDVEWAADGNGEICLLQCRPLKIIRESPAAADQEAEIGCCLLRGGITASPGAAAGPIRLLKKDVDGLNCPDRSVLVAAQASPRWAPLLSRAAAMVTEQGSHLGHLANVAREFHVPAIFGLASAMEVLAGRGTVTVDADGRRILDGEAASLLARMDKPRNLMLDSPVYHILEKAVPLIVPLRLLDPDSAQFTPANCASLHDLTRFCHEMSVRELHAGLRDFSIPEKSSKRLYHGGRAMQYWIIDLDGGFEGNVQGHLVTIDQIASTPMLALWRGMTAVPLAGPPAMDARGFLSVMVESSANPELDPTLASSFQAKNYFLISRDYCCLQSRFGFHFCTVEAQAGGDPEANYASFQFKGGAADLPRRISRALLLAGLLEDLDFRVDLKQDSLFARLEGLPREQVEERLAALGHLAMHTRQLDMLMGAPGEWEAARNRLRQELSLFSGNRNGAGSPDTGGARTKVV